MAKNDAFKKICSNKFKQDYANDIAQRTKKQRSKKHLFLKSLSGLAAAAAMFSIVCIANPALAEQIPILGHVFETIGETLGYSGDYGKYVTPLQSETDWKEAGESELIEAAVVRENNAFEKTVDGVTVTLSEVYCNGATLYVGVLFKSEDPFPESADIEVSGKRILDLDYANMVFSYNEGTEWYNVNVEGEFLDDHLFAGVIAMDLIETGYSLDDQYDEEKYAFFETVGVTKEELTENPKEAWGTLNEIFGMDMFSEENIALCGGPDRKDYESWNEIPEEFSVSLKIPRIVGDKKEDTTPEIPQELMDEYHAALAEAGLNYEEYESFTVEEKEIDLQLMNQMWDKYAEMYPGVNDPVNPYRNWCFEGPWEFEFDVKVNHEDTIEIAVNDMDENGIGIGTVIKTPFELSVETISESSLDYFTVALDANGEILPYGVCTTMGTWSIQNRDISRVDFYICDWHEYMNELKGYYWSEDYEEKKKTKTFKQLLDERALHHTEVTFE